MNTSEREKPKSKANASTTERTPQPTVSAGKTDTHGKENTREKDGRRTNDENERANEATNTALALSSFVEKKEKVYVLTPPTALIQVKITFWKGGNFSVDDGESTPELRRGDDPANIPFLAAMGQGCV